MAQYPFCLSWVRIGTIGFIRGGRLPFLLAAGIVLSLIVALALTSAGLELRVVPVKSGQPLLVLPMKPGERFTLHYYHSVENAPIWEVHSLDDKGRIYIEEERYLKFGAGMGKMPGVGRMVRRGPYEVIENMHRPTGDFVLRIGSPGVDHTILWRDHSVNLSAMAPHVAVEFSARPVSRLYMYWRQLFPHPATPR
ncbi:MAG: DUF1850 domain-containing protein [Desulfobacterales bacterium]|nr:DUF1850 domain-containing protein [Desulfobacterales bacterium]